MKRNGRLVGRACEVVEAQSSGNQGRLGRTAGSDGHAHSALHKHPFPLSATSDEDLLSLAKVDGDMYVNRYHGMI